MEVDLASGRAKDTPTLIRHSKHGSGVAEGSHIFKKGGWYYLSVAEGGTEKDHQQWIFRSSSGPFGPWEEPPSGSNPILYNGNHPSIQQTGHMDLVEGDNGWWAVFLAIRSGRDGAKGWSQLGRETFLAPVEWVDGWPKVNGGRPVEINTEADLPRSEEECSVDLLPSAATGETISPWIVLILNVRSASRLVHATHPFGQGLLHDPTPWIACASRHVIYPRRRRIACGCLPETDSFLWGVGCQGRLPAQRRGRSWNGDLVVTPRICQSEPPRLSFRTKATNQVVPI